MYAGMVGVYTGLVDVYIEMIEPGREGEERKERVWVCLCA